MNLWSFPERNAVIWIAISIVAVSGCVAGNSTSEDWQDELEDDTEDDDSQGSTDAGSIGDECPGDPLKIGPGKCGCGVPDKDSDKDGTVDCFDSCPYDPNKTEPGFCGCGAAEDDFDEDGAPNCVDQCPSDPRKTEQGVCGCGVFDTDSDGDGVLDCIDQCPNDPGKADPGVCGCGSSDDDFDGDGTADCIDQCPSDPLGNVKTKWYPDCDDDGEPSPFATVACSDIGASLALSCSDGKAPDGGWSTAAGVDCDDEDGDNPCACGEQYHAGDKTCEPVGLLRASCLEISASNPQAPDGIYEIDPDGPGGGDPFEVTCDMSGGGWTLIYQEDFESGDSSGWENGASAPTPVDTASNCAAAHTNMLGGHGIMGVGAQTVQTFDVLGIPHTDISVKLDYLVFDSWDSELALVYVDDVEQYSAAFHSGDSPSSTCGGGWPDHGPQAVDIETAHGDQTVTIKVTSTLDQPASDESFGVDNIFIWIR